MNLTSKNDNVSSSSNNEIRNTIIHQSNALIAYFSTGSRENVSTTLLKPSDNRKIFDYLGSRENVSTTLLKPSDNRKIFDYLGPRCFTLATGVAQLLQADIQKYQWEIIGIGVACYVRDYNRREVSVQLIDPGYLGSSMERCKLILSPDVTFIKKHSNLITFEADDDTSYALNFSLSVEAEKFFFTVHHQQTERRRRKAMKKECTNTTQMQQASQPSRRRRKAMKKECTNTTQMQQASQPSIPSINETREKILEISKQTTCETHQLHRTHNNMTAKGISTDLSAKMHNAITSLKRSVPKRKKSEAKKNKGGLNKLDIGFPTDFVHKAHCGTDSFIDDSEVDQTVREIYAFLMIDINKADEQEINMIRGQVTFHGPDKLRSSMRRSRPPMLNINENDAESLMTAANSLNSLEDARDSFRLTSRDQGRITPTSIKRSHTIKRRISNKGNELSKQCVENPYIMLAPQRNELERHDFNVMQPSHRPLEKIEKHRDEWSISSSEMRNSAKMPPARIPHPPPSSVNVPSNANYNLPTSPTTRVGTTTERAPVISQQQHKFGHNIREQYDECNATTWSNHNKTSESSPEKNMIPPAPPPPPPPPPPAAAFNNASSSGATSHPHTTSQGRQNLLEAIRNADKSALRKVDRPLSSSGNNLMDAIGRMIEERRQHIRDSSDGVSFPYSSSVPE
uniref:CRIB domain-containing protein n=1 Tax=Ascaris lumbricoides TaxID=6252 RepID=A0A0M3II89_ASCLU